MITTILKCLYVLLTYNKKNEKTKRIFIYIFKYYLKYLNNGYEIYNIYKKILNPISNYIHFIYIYIYLYFFIPFFFLKKKKKN